MSNFLSDHLGMIVIALLEILPARLMWEMDVFSSDRDG